MAHSHEGEESYFLDQIFSIAMCGALGGICVLLYVKQTMLKWILDPKFHPYLLAGGITLLVLVAIRAVALWQMAGEIGKHAHEHHHDHHHDHEHGECQHDHGHAHEAPAVTQGLTLGLPQTTAEEPHQHAHSHEHHHHANDHHHHHAHDHGHDHGHGHGHDAGWAPWRYTVLMLPIVLFMLNLPNEGFSANYKDVSVEDEQVLADWSVASTVGLLSPSSGGGPLLASSVLYPGRNDRFGDGFVTPGKVDQYDIHFSDLEKAAYEANLRAQLHGRSVTLIGKFVAGEDNNRFGLVRYRMNCCAADALPLNAVIMINPSWQGERLDVKARQQKWVMVTGRIYFLKKRGTDDYVPAVIVFPGKEYPPNSLVEIIDQPANPYAQ